MEKGEKMMLHLKRRFTLEEKREREKKVAYFKLLSRVFFH